MKQEQTEKKTDSESKLVQKFRSGKCSATIFSKDIDVNGKKVTVYATKIVKSYTVDDGKTWKETTNYDKTELTNLRLVTEKAIEYLYLKE